MPELLWRPLANCWKYGEKSIFIEPNGLFSINGGATKYTTFDEARNECDRLNAKPLEWTTITCKAGDYRIAETQDGLWVSLGVGSLSFLTPKYHKNRKDAEEYCNQHQKGFK